MTRMQVFVLILGWLLISIGAGLAWLPAGLMVAGALALAGVYLSVMGDAVDALYREKRRRKSA